MKKIILAAVFVSSVGAMSAYAASVPRSVSADHRVKLVQYDPNNIVILKGHYGYQTQISFAPNEQVQSVSLGDSLAWQAVPVGNYLFIKPVAASKSNMTVLTNQNSYNFQLDSESQDVSPTYKLQFVYPNDGISKTSYSNSFNNFDPAKFNWKYSFTGDRSIVPLEAFDNDQFTYFKFNTNGMSKLPAVFMVGKHRNESLVNYHMQGDYLVVHGVARQFTFRLGDEVASIYNDAAIGDWSSVKGV